MQIKLKQEEIGQQNMNLEVESTHITVDRCMSDSGFIWNCVIVKRDALNRLKLYAWLTLANHSRLFVLYTPYSYQMTVSRQIYFYTTSAVSCRLPVFSPKKQFSSFRFLLFS